MNYIPVRRYDIAEILKGHIYSPTITPAEKLYSSIQRLLEEYKDNETVLYKIWEWLTIYDISKKTANYSDGLFKNVCKELEKDE